MIALSLLNLYYFSALHYPVAVKMQLIIIIIPIQSLAAVCPWRALGRAHRADVISGGWLRGFSAPWTAAVAQSCSPEPAARRAGTR